MLHPDEETLKDALKELCVKDTQWCFTPTGVWYLLSEALNPEVILWNYWVKNWIYPTTHDRKVSVQPLLAAYFLSKGYSFNMGKVLAE